ncbi:MAG: hypothetical protein JWM27_1894 [Gemmatimonadetes bacterium]|nr:hypothetical protein [Gemmatimonadota bacterium]
MPTSPPYLPPLDQLVALGDPTEIGEDWPDYPAMGIAAEHVPELIRMARDRDMLKADAETPEGWAGLHAWRALGQLRAPSAAVPLLRLMVREADEDNDWAMEEIPVVLGMIGPPALEPLQEMLPLLAREDEWSVTAAVGSALVKVAKHFPDTRDAVVAALARQLESARQQDATTNAFLVSNLLSLSAVEAAAVMEAAFAGEEVDEAVVGDWEDVQISLGLRTERSTPRRRIDFGLPKDFLGRQPPRSAPKPPTKTKQQRKAEKAARKRNRKKR